MLTDEFGGVGRFIAWLSIGDGGTGQVSLILSYNVLYFNNSAYLKVLTDASCMLVRDPGLIKLANSRSKN